MNIASAKQQIKDTVEAYLKVDEAGLPLIASAHQRPVFLLGAPGIGKTAIMEQVARELGIGIVSYSMTHHTRQSALGLPRIEHRRFGDVEFEASEYTMSEIVAAVYGYMEETGLRQGILFLDEINCVSETLYPSMLQFLQFKRFGSHQVPEGWVVVCAGNPPEYNRSVHEFDIVTLDRLREIDVEPDHGAWKRYAAERGIHPAVTTFLEAKKDCFYKVESKPGGGKSFVTARGWEDLADLITVYEAMGKPVDRELVVQFLRDDDIADQFAVYYGLFEKYRSDYQVDAILAGEAPAAIEERAKGAEFDERLALMSLVLDVLARECAAVLDEEAVMLQLRDELRGAKAELLGGGTVEAALQPRITAREGELARKRRAGTASEALVRRESLIIERLKGYGAQCALKDTEEGDEAFHTIEQAYKGQVEALKPLVANVGSRMDAAFDFIDGCFGDREMLVFMAELATRRATTQFVAHHGNERYYAHNEHLQVDAGRMGLAERAEMLDRLSENIEAAAEAEVVEDPLKLIDTSASAVVQEVQVAPEESSGASVRSADEGATDDRQACIGEVKPIDRAMLKAYYAGKQFEYGFATICKMLLPASELAHKKVLDIGCRRGRGVYKISAMVGDGGEAWGVDWNRAYVAESKDGQDRAWHDSGLKHDNMDFRWAFPEDLIEAGIGNEVFDVVYVNNVMTLFYDQEQAIREMSRVLRPGGLLIMETIFASEARPQEVIDAARAIGNSVQAARTQEENLAWLAAAGFGEPSIEDSYEVAANQGYKAGQTVPTVEDAEGVSYRAVSMYIYKS